MHRNNEAPTGLVGRVALVTGGSGGIGSAICRALADAGAAVVVGYNRSRDKAEQIVNELPDNTLGHAAMRAPVTDTPAINDLARRVDKAYGRCDLLVNCAGTTRFVPHADLDSLDDQLIDEILATNVRGCFACVRAFRDLLARHGNGMVINITSIAGTTANGSNIMYCASKAAADNMTRSLARALAPDIRVIAIAPGLVDTDFVAGLDQQWRDEQARRTPLGRLAEPAEIGAAVAAAATGLTFTTGSIIAVDGGRPLV